MTQHIEAYLASRQARIAQRPRQPIIMKWLKSPDMAPALAIIDWRAAELASSNEPGAAAKLDQWFLADDQNFNAITAERCILQYLGRQNPNLVDHLQANGIDAHLDFPTGEVGVEITTLNAFVADWIVVERLTEYCRNHHFFQNKGLEITCSVRRIQTETQGSTIYTYVELVGQALLAQDIETLSQFDVSVDYAGASPGCISWRYDDDDTFPWFRHITDDLVQKLSASNKQRQFSSYGRNIVFVGVNHVGPTNWAVPQIFAALGGREDISFEDTIEALQRFWDTSLPLLNSIYGLCYFTYSLNQETPFYPLQMFWRPDVAPIPIAL